MANMQTFYKYMYYMKIIDIIILYTDIAKLLCLIVYRNLILRVPENTFSPFIKMSWWKTKIWSTSNDAGNAVMLDVSNIKKTQLY